LINKSFAQLNAERAARRAELWTKNLLDARKKIKENRKKNKPSSSQAGGPAPDESALKRDLKILAHEINTIIK